MSRAQLPAKALCWPARSARGKGQRTVRQCCSPLCFVPRWSTWSSCSLGHHVCWESAALPSHSHALDSISWLANVQEAYRVRTLLPSFQGRSEEEEARQVRKQRKP